MTNIYRLALVSCTHLISRWLLTTVMHLKTAVFSPQTNPYYVKPRVNDHQFGIKHYAGEVITHLHTSETNLTFLPQVS